MLNTFCFPLYSLALYPSSSCFALLDVDLYRMPQGMLWLWLLFGLGSADVKCWEKTGKEEKGEVRVFLPPASFTEGAMAAVLDQMSQPL